MWDEIKANTYARSILNLMFFVLVALHLFYIRKYGVNTPWMDEWEALKPGNLDYQLHWNWLFASHNEHRIVLTKLLNWIQFHIDGLNYRHTMYANFILYSGVVFALREWFLVTIWQKFIFTLFAMSTLSVENFSWAFQNQFHFFILFFLMALYTSKFSGRLWWLAPFLATVGVYSFSCGVICMACMIAYWFLEIVLKRNQMGFQLMRILTGIAVLATWASRYQSNPGHPPMAMPWTVLFWDYFFNVVSLAFGYDHSKSALPGAVVVGLCVYFVMALLTLKDLRRSLQKNQALVMTTVTGFACLALIAASRAGFGVWQSKSSRYAEVGILILPLTILAIDKVQQMFRARPVYLKVFITICMLLPLKGNFSFPKAYKEISEIKQLSQNCIDDYYLGKNKGDCPGYIANIADRLEYAKSLKLRFTQ